MMMNESFNQYIPDEGISLGSPTRLGLAQSVSAGGTGDTTDSGMQTALFNRLSNISPVTSQDITTLGTDLYPRDLMTYKLGQQPAGEMLNERMIDRVRPQPSVRFLPDFNINVSTIPPQLGAFEEYRQPAPDLFELDRLARNNRAMQQQEGLGRGSINPTPYISSLEGISPLNAFQSPQLFPQPVNEMMNERMNWQQSPAIQLGQSPAELQALQDMTRQSSSGYTPTNIWDYNPMWPVQSIFDSAPFPMTPGTQGFLDYQDPYFQQRLNEAYIPALSSIADGAMNANLFNAWLNLATRNR